MNPFVRYINPIASVPFEMTKSLELFRKMVMGASVLACLAHVAFFILFYINGVDILAVINVGSMLCYVAAFILVMRYHSMAAWLLIIIEVVTHALVATSILGWESFFHVHLLLLLPVIMVSNMDKWYFKIPLVSIMIVLYIWMDFRMRVLPPLFILDPMAISFLHRFNLLTFMVFLVVINGMHYRLVVQTERGLRDLAATDPLTGLRNRRSILEKAMAGVAGQKRYGRPLSFLMCDIDYFKRINDTYGHECGDVVIKEVAALLKREVRELDCTARWGGEEFLLLLPETPLEGARLLAERLREKVSLLEVIIKNTGISVTMTFGVSTLAAGESIDRAIDRADGALYRGKNAGRNRVEVAHHDNQPGHQA